jgi:hypothetical protein
MSTFDGSTGTRAPRSDGLEPAADADMFADAVDTPYDALASLRDSMAQRDEEDPTTTVEIPGLGWRLVCSTDMPYPTYAKWQKASFPRAQRSGRKVNPLDMDQAVLSTFVLLGTCVGMEYRHRASGEWLPLMDSRGEPMLPNSREIMDMFNQVDEKAFIRKLFRNDANVTKAGTKVMEAAGWKESDDEDPTDED